jgi:hypothetical protein
MGEKKPRITWHTAFYDAIRLELIDYRDILDFDIEHQLTREPLRIDMVIVKKKKDVRIGKHIAAIFKKWNLLEYKSPKDVLSIADFHKGMAYAHLYCTPPEPGAMDEVTVTFVVSRTPRELKKYLREVCHYTLTETWPGITVITGGLMAMQIIERKKLSAGESLWLASLCGGLSRERRRTVIATANTLPKDAPIGAYMYILVQANDRMAEELRMDGQAILEQVFMDTGVFAEWEAKGEAKGKAEERNQVLELIDQCETLEQLKAKLKKTGDPDKKIAKL